LSQEERANRKQRVGRKGKTIYYLQCNRKILDNFLGHEETENKRWGETGKRNYLQKQKILQL
jgi:hypothetical protein